MRRQKGVSTYTAIFFAALAGFAGFFAFKTVPLYMDNYAVDRILNDIAAEPGSSDFTDYDIRLKVQQRLDINSIRSITGADVRINRNQIGVFISIPRETRIDLFYNLDIVATFDNTVEIVR